MNYTKKVKVLKQHGTMITIPKTMCELMSLEQGNSVVLTLDTDSQVLTIKKEQKNDIFKLQKDGKDVLVFNRDKSILFTIPFSDVRNCFDTVGQVIAYVEGRYTDGKFSIIGNVNQDW